MIHKNISNNNRVLPNFLCIGVMRGGSTWLYENLKDHPEIYLCPYHKETHFFSRYYDKGLNWYRSFFPKKNEAKRYKAIGEIAPTYYFQKKAPKLISKHLPHTRFIVILRNPVNRAFSEYKYHKLNFGFSNSFEEYLKEYPYIIRIGLYAQYLKNWFNYFPKDHFLILIFEEIMGNPLKALKNVSLFLDVDFKRFHKNQYAKSINPSNPPRLSKLYLLSYKFYKIFESKELFRFTRAFSILKPYFYMLGEKKNQENINPNFKKQLYSKFKKDIEELEKNLNRNLNIWRF